MNILDNTLSPLKCIILDEFILPVCPKSFRINIPIGVKEEDRLNVKSLLGFSSGIDYNEKDIFKEHLISHIW